MCVGVSVSVIGRPSAEGGRVTTDQRAVVYCNHHRGDRSRRVVSVMSLQCLDLSATQGRQEGPQEPRQAWSVN